MAKYLKRITQSKVPCMVTMDIKEVSVEVGSAMSLSVRWTRGPQVDQSEKFEVTPDATKYNIVQSFSRASTLYREKGGSISKKTCMLELVASDGSIAGSVEVDLGPMVGKENFSYTFDFENLNNIQNATLTGLFTIRELSKEEAAEAMKGRGIADAVSGLRKSVGAFSSVAGSDQFAEVADALGVEEI